MDTPDVADTLGACVVCGEQVAEGNAAEMYDPADTDEYETCGLVHVDCGLSKGWEVA